MSGTSDGMHDERIPHYIAATQEMQKGNYQIDVPIGTGDSIGKIGIALNDLAQNLERRHREMHYLNLITTDINSGLLLDEILEGVYRDFREIVPYNRIGFSFLEENGKVVRAYWSKSDQHKTYLKNGYVAPLAGSSLQTIIETRQPRIINDLLEYFKQKPRSRSTQLILKEGMRSSLTCPLIANDVPIGFVFFSSTEPNAYDEDHIELFMQITAQLSVIVEKGRLITELATQKAAIEQKNDELRRANELKNSFLGVAAHDLRSPLSNVQMAANLLADPTIELPEDQRRVVINEIVVQANYMMALLNDLLDVSHIESGKFSINLQPIQISTFLQEIAQRHQQTSQSRGVQVVVNQMPESHASVDADPMRLRQVFDNLLSNAVKFTAPGGTVYMRALHQQSDWRFEVQDQGPGISDIDQQRLFQDFARLNTRPTNGEKSTGLGLAISRRVIEAHHGHIGVESQLGQGATFWFTLPH
ncbi:MAG: ATP-binding protein [Anaerolineae bacterium]